MPRWVCCYGELPYCNIDVDRSVSDERPRMKCRHTDKEQGSLVICTKCGVVVKYQQIVPPGFDGSMALLGQPTPRGSLKD